MGFYIRKALKVGPVRFNLSKSGVGLSAGIKGLRLGTGPRGNYIHMGRKGLYFRKSLNSASQQHPLLPVNEPDTVDGLAEEFQKIESGSSIGMVDASSSELLDELNEKRKKIRIAPITIILCVGLLLALVGLKVPIWAFPILIVVSIFFIWLTSMQDALRKTTVAFYELEPEVEKSYQRLHDAFAELGSCSRLWHISARAGVHDPKYYAGAKGLVKLDHVILRIGAPPLLKTNLVIPLISTGKRTLAFMPDRELIFDNEGVGAIRYDSLNLEVTEVQFAEEDSVPQDSTIIGTTWRYVNKKGGPDRRFKDNREIPICAYEQLHLSSPSGLNEVIQVSRRGVAENLRIALASMGELT